MEESEEGMHHLPSCLVRLPNEATVLDLINHLYPGAVDLSDSELLSGYELYVAAGDGTPNMSFPRLWPPQKAVTRQAVAETSSSSPLRTDRLPSVASESASLAMDAVAYSLRVEEAKLDRTSLPPLKQTKGMRFPFMVHVSDNRISESFSHSFTDEAIGELSPSARQVTSVGAGHSPTHKRCPSPQPKGALETQRKSVSRSPSPTHDAAESTTDAAPGVGRTASERKRIREQRELEKQRQAELEEKRLAVIKAREQDRKQKEEESRIRCIEREKLRQAKLLDERMSELEKEEKRKAKAEEVLQQKKLLHKRNEEAHSRALEDYSQRRSLVMSKLSESGSLAVNSTTRKAESPVIRSPTKKLDTILSFLDSDTEKELRTVEALNAKERQKASNAEIELRYKAIMQAGVEKRLAMKAQLRRTTAEQEIKQIQFQKAEQLSQQAAEAERKLRDRQRMEEYYQKKKEQEERALQIAAERTKYEDAIQRQLNALEASRFEAPAVVDDWRLQADG